MLNELRRELYSKIKIEKQYIELPKKILKSNKTNEQKFVIKVDNLEYLRLLDLDKFAEIVYLINPQSDIKKLADLPKNKIRIALPAVCRHPKIYSDIVDKLLNGGYNKWEIANYWGLEFLPCERLDISFDSSLYMLNTQAMSMAAEMKASRITFSLEDNKSNVIGIATQAPLCTQLVIYQDIPLFTSVGCIRDNDCAHCKQQPLWFDLQRDGRKFKALSNHCQMMVFDDKPFCIASSVQDIAADYLRMDFVYRKYDAENVKNIVDELIQQNDVSNCICGNFINNNL